MSTKEWKWNSKTFFQFYNEERGAEKTYIQVIQERQRVTVSVKDQIFQKKFLEVQKVFFQTFWCLRNDFRITTMNEQGSYL